MGKGELLYIYVAKVRKRKINLQRRIARRNDQAPFRRRIRIRQLERLRREVRHEDDGWSVSEEFFYYSGCIGEVFLEHGEGKRRSGIAVSGCKVLGAQAGEHVGTLGEDLEQPGCCAGGGVLGGEEEGEEGGGDFLV